MALNGLGLAKALGLAAVLTCLALSARAQDQPSPIGLWLTQNQGGVIRIDRHQGQPKECWHAIA